MRQMASDRLTAVPTILHAGEAFNVVPGRGELSCDLRADSDAAILDVLDDLPREIDGVTLEPELIRLWPGMSSEQATAPLLERAGAALGRPVVGVRRGGASDASHLAPSIPLTVDGLGPRGGKAHNPGEFVLGDSLASRAEVALAVIDAALARLAPGSALSASDSSSRGRSSASSSPRAPLMRTAATPPFLKSTRAPVRSSTICSNDGLCPTTSTRSPSSWASSSSRAASRSNSLPSTSRGSGVTLSCSHASSAVLGGAHERARVTGGELQPEPRERLAGSSRLTLAARGQLAVEILLGVVRDGFTVPQEPELLGGHEPGAWTDGSDKRTPRAAGASTAQYGRIGGPVIFAPSGRVQRAR